MTKQEELDLFIKYSDELIKCNYILAEAKMINVLRVMSASDTITRLLKLYLASYNYVQAKRMCLRGSSYGADNRGEVVLPSAPKDIFTFVFCLLMDFNNRKVNFMDFLTTYFYENGSPYESYVAFANGVLKPFQRAVKTLMESVMNGKLLDPAIQEEQVMRVIKNTEVPEDVDIYKDENFYNPYQEGNYTASIIACLAEDRITIENRVSQEDAIKREQIFVINAFQCAVKSEDRETMVYAYITYKYMSLVYKHMHFNLKPITKILKEQKII